MGHYASEVGFSEEALREDFELRARLRTGPPKKLQVVTEAGVTGVYDPAPTLDFEGADQEIQILYPFFLMSGVGWVCTVGPKFRGYLSKFTPMELVEGEEPTATVTITKSE